MANESRSRKGAWIEIKGCVAILIIMMSLP